MIKRPEQMRPDTKDCKHDDSFARWLYEGDTLKAAGGCCYDCGVDWGLPLSEGKLTVTRLWTKAEWNKSQKDYVAKRYREMWR